MNHQNDALFDPRIAEWLEDDPNDAPPQILETVAAAMPAIAQRRPRLVQVDRLRRPWWMGLAAASLVVAFVGALALLNWPSIGPRPAPSPSSVALPQRVDAPVHRYSASLPADWTATLGEAVDEPDIFTGPDGSLSVRFELIPTGTSQDEWADAYIRARIGELGGSCFGVSPDSWQPSRVGLEGAYEWELPCINAILYHTAVGDRTYPIEYVSSVGDVSPAERGIVREILLGFVLDQGPTVLPSASPART